MFIDPFNGTPSLLKSLRLLGQVEVKDGCSFQPDVVLVQRVQHHHDVDWAFPFPVFGQCVEQVISVHALTPLVSGQPGGHAGAYVVKMLFEPTVEGSGYDVAQRFAVREELAALEVGDRGRVKEVKFKVKGV